MSPFTYTAPPALLVGLVGMHTSSYAMRTPEARPSLKGLTYVQIGERLGISPKTAYSRMVRALDLLKLGMPE